MKKLLSKALAVVMAAALCVGMCATALAATPDADDRGSITINGLTEGVTVNAYQIAHATYDADGNFLGYEMNATVAGGFVINSDGSYDEDDLTEANLAALYAALNGATATGSATAGSDGTATIEDLPVGSYLIVITDSESVVYSMMIGSVYYATEDGDWAIESGEIDVIASDNLWAKSTTPQVEKTEHGGSIDGDDWEHGGSADLYDTLEYHITVGPIPSYQGSNPEFYVTDEISTELTITSDELAAMTITVINDEGETIATLTKGTDYTVYAEGDTFGEGTVGHGFVVDFVVGGTYTLNSYVGLSLLIDFSADVTEATGTADDDDHLNDVTLTYATTSYVSGYDNEVDDEDHDYTFNARIQKVDSTDNTVFLENAVFSLYTDEKCSTAYTQNNSAVTATSDSDGYFEFTGLEEGTYYMKETTAPVGYLLNDTVYRIEIIAEYDETTGALTNYTITVYDNDTNETVGSANVTNGNAQISNEKVSESPLPNTGGMGTTIFYIIGGVLVAGAVVVLVTRRRMSHEA